MRVVALGLVGGWSSAPVWGLLVGAVLLLIAPIFLEEFWLRTGFAICGAAIGAIQAVTLRDVLAADDPALDAPPLDDPA